MVQSNLKKLCHNQVEEEKEEYSRKMTDPN